MTVSSRSECGTDKSENEGLALVVGGSDDHTVSVFTYAVEAYGLSQAASTASQTTQPSTASSEEQHTSQSQLVRCLASNRC